jgi:hypothetical protein
MKFVIAGVLLVTLLSGCTPEHNPCSTEGSIKVDSQYGTFHCVRVSGGELQWEKDS